MFHLPVIYLEVSQTTGKWGRKWNNRIIYDDRWRHSTNEKLVLGQLHIWH
jgi:hypothetical protein